MGFDASKVPIEHADLFYKGFPDEQGNPVGLSDEEYDAQRDDLRAEGLWPLDHHDD